MREGGYGQVDSPTLKDGGGGDTLFAPTGALKQLPEEDYEKAKMIWQMYQKAKKWKMQCGAGDWDRYWQLWKSKQWLKPRPVGMTQMVVNVLYEVIETFLGHLIDNIPDLKVHARKPSQQEIAEIVNMLLNWSDDLNDLELNLETPVRSATVTGFGCRRVDWNPDMDMHRGAPGHSFVDENFVFVSPWARTKEEASYVTEAKNVPITEVRSRWENGKLVPPGVWDGSLTPLHGYGTTTGVDQYSAFTTTDGSATQITKAGSMNDKAKDLVTLIETWIRQDDGTIRYVVCANGVILQDGPSPYDDEKYPYSFYNVIRSKDHPYGYSLISFVEQLQYSINESISYAIDQQKYESDSPLVVNTANIDEAKGITNEPGQIYVDATPDGRGYYLLQKPGMNPKWNEIVESFVQKVRDITGNVDILRGGRPPGVSTLGAMEIVRDEANTLVAKMTRQVMGSRKEEARLTISRLRQFFKDERVIRVTGAEGTDEYQVANERVGVDLKGDEVVRNSIPEDFEADVDFTPDPPGGMQARLERDLALLQAGVVDQQFVLEDLEFDRATIQNITQRVQEQQSAAAEAEAAAKNPEGAAAQDPELIRQKVLSMFSGM